MGTEARPQAIHFKGIKVSNCVGTGILAITRQEARATSSSVTITRAFLLSFHTCGATQLIPRDEDESSSHHSGKTLVRGVS